MSDEHNQQAQEIADAALLLDVSMREQMLDKLGAVSPDLRIEVEALLAKHDTIDVGDVLAENTTNPHEKSPDEVATLDAIPEILGPDDETQQFGASVGNDSGLETIGGSLHSKRVPEGFGTDYEILGTIGRGGMGTVFKAYQRSLKRHVALKTILQENLRSPADVARFQIEAEAAARLDHPGIVPVYDIGEFNGLHYYCMAYVEGVSLSDLLKRGKQRIKPLKAAELMEKVCGAVQYAHDRAVIHRDLKPSNIMLDSDGNPRLTDFGLAKLQKGGNNLTMTGQVLGTPSFMAPEQAAGKLQDISNRTDVYSLGATLYALLSGRPPFKGETIVDTLRQVVSEEPPLLKNSADDIHSDLQTICSKCMAKLPADRYASAAEVADDLRSFLGGFPIAARPLGPLARAVRWCRRNPLVATLLSAVAVSLVAGTIVSLAFGVKASRQERIASAQRDRAEQYGEQLEKAIEDFFVVVSEDTLMNQPGMQALRERLLQKAIEHYQRAAQQAAEDMVSSDRPAHALVMLGKLEAADERFEDAGRSLRKAQLILEQIVDGSVAKSAVENSGHDPTRLEPLTMLASTHNELARVASQQFQRLTKLRPFAELADQESEEAGRIMDNWQRHAQETVELRERVVERGSDDIESIRLLANAYMNQGTAVTAPASASGQVGEAEHARELMLKAQEIRQSAMSKYPGQLQLVRDLGTGFHGLGQLESRVAKREQNVDKRSRRQERAIEEFTNAIQSFEVFVETSNELDARYRLASCYRERADLHFDRHQVDPAEADYIKAIVLAGSLSESNPRVYTYRVMLAEIQYNYCQLLFVRNQAAEALGMLDSCQRTLVAAMRIYPDFDATRPNRAAEDYTRFVIDIAQRIAGIEQFEIAKERLQLAIDELQKLVDESPEFGNLKRRVQQLRSEQEAIQQQADERSNNV